MNGQSSKSVVDPPVRKGKVFPIRNGHHARTGALVPEGPVRLAQRFNAGWDHPIAPKSRRDARHIAGPQSSLRDLDGLGLRYPTPIANF
jgi:hypothetical protein